MLIHESLLEKLNDDETDPFYRCLRSYCWKARLPWLCALLGVCLASSLQCFCSFLQNPLGVHSEFSPLTAVVGSLAPKWANHCEPWELLDSVDAFPPFAAASLRDFRKKWGLLFCCSSSFPSSQMCVTFHSIILRSLEIIFRLCHLGRILTGKRQYSVTVLCSVICANTWMMKILVCSAVWVLVISHEPV